ncbi:MAG: hypothetical protein ACJ8C4_10370 [Gemmataceae bacterium]
MNASIALAALLSLSPSQAGGLAVTNPHVTYRDFGSTRPDARYLPGDVFFLSFDIDGLKTNDVGEVNYLMGVEVLDKVGKAIFSAPSSKSTVPLPLGGSKLPGNVYVTIGQDMQPGPYTCKVTISDAAVPNASKIVEQKFEVLPRDFGLVALYISRDQQGTMPNGMSGIEGQTVYVHVGLVGFGRDVSQKPDAALEFSVRDAHDQPTTKKPSVILLSRTLSETAAFEGFSFVLPLNQQGTFTVQIKAADKVTGKTATLSFPVKVYPASK